MIETQHHETIYQDADHFFQSLNSEIRKAQQYIYLNYYIFDFDDIGKTVIKNLIRASKRGIEIKLIVDGIGSSSLSKQHIHFLRKFNIEIKIHNPLPWKLSHFSKLNFTSIRKSILQINKRDHKKLCIIDDSTTFIGSINITHLHSRRIIGDLSWRDSAVRIIGPISKNIRQLFLNQWNEEKSMQYLNQNFLQTIPIRHNQTHSQRRHSYSKLISKIELAKERIWLTTPYFVPNNQILNLLNQAASRGVDVKIIIPRKSDMKYFPLINSLFYRLLTEENVQIFEYLPTILHAKTAIIDDWICMGSSNLNSRSLLHDFEIDYMPVKFESKSLILQQFRYDLHHSRRVQFHDIISRYLMPHLFEPFFKLIRYWL
ncbi:MAG: phospholipase D-like domain-containing protein [Bdellovibrio sp.]